MSLGQAGAAALLLLAVLFARATGVEGHAFLERASPRVGSTVRAGPATVRLRFTERVEAAFSTMRVVDEAGRQIDLRDPQVDPSSSNELRVSLPPLGPGLYRVFWRVLSVDSHVTEGDFTFQVRP